ncbi:MAG TPA: BlaI/MecI/CopY family transcriptional regulator [Pirellulales bacterium]
MTERESLGKVELEILQLVEQLQPVSVRALVDQLAESSGQARTTLLTTLERLRAKGYVTRRKLKGVNHYSTRVPVTQVLQRLVGDFVQRMLGGSVSPFVAYLQRAEGIDPAELAELKTLVQKLEDRRQTGDRPASQEDAQ